MDASRFDALARLLSDTLSRRRLTRVVGGLSLGAPLALGGLAETSAKGKKRHHHKKKKKRTPPSPPPPASGGCASGEKPCGTGCIPSTQCCGNADCPTTRICNTTHQCCTKNDFPDGGSSTTCCSQTSIAGFCRGRAAGQSCAFSDECQTVNCVHGACSSCPESFDTCARSTETCPTGQCLKAIDGTTRCGLRDLTIACNACTSDAQCSAGEFCVIDTGPNCNCPEGQTFCARTF